MKFNDLILLAAILLIAISGQPSSPGQTEAAAAIRCQNGVCERVYKEETFQTESAPTPAPQVVESLPPVEAPEQSILQSNSTNTTSNKSLLSRCRDFVFGEKNLRSRVKSRSWKLFNRRGRR